jgi:hypothetical protein
MGKIIEFPGPKKAEGICKKCPRPVHPAQIPGDKPCGLCEVCCIIATIEEAK